MSKYNLHDEQRVWFAYGKGHGKRQIARDLNMPYSTVWDIIYRIENQEYESRKPLILYADTENALAQAYIWRCGKQYVGYKQLRRDWHIHCAQWMWEGEDEVHHKSQHENIKRWKKNHRDDYEVIKAIWDLCHKADIVVFQNGNRFDWPNIQARAMKHKLPPIKKPMFIDTCQLMRKTGMTSKSLGFACDFYELDNVKDGSNYDWWIAANEGDIEACEKIVTYGDKDIKSMRDLYHRIARYFPESLPNANLWTGADFACPVPACGGELEIDGVQRRGKTSIVTAYKCKKCGAYCHDGKNLRKGMIVRA